METTPSIELAVPRQPVVSRRALLRGLLILVVAAIPVFATVLLVNFHLHTSLTDFVPVGSDELNYWHETLTFIHAGFQGGYYTINELPPAASFTHFYTHGPWYPIVFGSIGKIIGWEFYTPVIINLALVMIALAVFMLMVRLNNHQIILIGLLMFTFWPVLLYMLTGMQESLQYALAILLAGVFISVLAKQERLSVRQQAAYAVLIGVAGVLRMSWGILFLPLFWLAAPRTTHARLLALVKSAIALSMVVVIAQYVGAPGNNSVFTVLGTFRNSVGYGLHILVLYVGFNLGKLLNPAKNPLDVLQTFQMLMCIVAFCIAPFFLWRRRRRLTPPDIHFHAYNLGAILIAGLALYIIGTVGMGDYRVFSAHLLLTLLVLIANRRYFPVFFIIITNLLLLPIFLSVYFDFSAPKFATDRQMMADYAGVMQENVRYDPQTINAWCNTLLHHVSDLNGPLLTGVPAGIGESFFREPDDPELPLKSQYVQLSDEVYTRLMQREPRPHLVQLAVLPNERTLYHNQDTDCAGK